MMVTARKGLGGCLRVIVLFTLCGLVNAQSLYKWVDSNGNVTYQDTPPPSNVEFEEQTYTDPDAPVSESANSDEAGDDAGNNAEDQLNTAVQASPVSLYSIPACDACDLVRLFLDNNAVPYAEKNIRGNETLQQELKEISGELTVPTVVIGDKVIDGYSKSALRETLIDKNYPLDQLAAANTGGDSTNTLDGEQIETGLDDTLDELTNVFDEATEQFEQFDDDEDEDFAQDDEAVLEIEIVE